MSDPLLDQMRGYANTEPDGQPTVGPIAVQPQAPVEADGQPTVGPITMSPQMPPGGDWSVDAQADGEPMVGAIKVSPGPPEDDGVGPIVARPAPKTEMGRARYAQEMARADQGQALGAEGQHAIAQGNAEAANFREQSRLQAQQAADNAKWAERFQTILAEKADKIRQTSDQLAEKSINPNRYIENMSGGETVLAAIGVLLAGIGGGILGSGRNVALEEIHRKVDADIDAQKADYEHGMHRLKGLENDYSLARERGLTDFEARKLLQNQAMSAVSMRLKESQAQGAGVAKNDQLQAALSDLDAKKAANDVALAQANEHQAASMAHSERMNELNHRQRMEEIMLTGAIGLRGANATQLRLEEKERRDQEKDVTKFGLEQKKLDKELDPAELKRLQEAFDKGGKGLSYLGNLRALVDTESRENRNTAARIAENWLRSKTGAASSDREREYMTKIQTGRATEAEYRDFLQRMQGFRKGQQEDLEGSFSPDVVEQFRGNRSVARGSEVAPTDAERIEAARKRLGITGPR